MTDKKQPRKKCFIIMPITTPDHMTQAYDGDLNHFEHVLEFLFRPAIEEADLEPISPIAKGSEQINSRIIQNIEKADLVLCDMSILNANVFFELGIRTALNKPICIVKDDKLLSRNVPFDIATINHHTYQSSIQLWNRDEEKNKLSIHIKESIEHSNENELWKHFSMSASAHSLEKSGDDDRIDYLVNLVEALRSERRQELTTIVDSSLDDESEDSYYEIDYIQKNTKIDTETINKIIIGFISTYIRDAKINKSEINNHFDDIKKSVYKNLIRKFRYNSIQANRLMGRYFNKSLTLYLEYAVK